MARWDRSRTLDAFLDDLARRGIGPEHLPHYSRLTIAFLRERQGRELQDLGPGDVDAFVATLTENQGAARTAASEFVRFVRAGGLVPIAAETYASPSPSPRPRPSFADESPLSADIKRVLTLEGVAFALAVCAPILLSVLGGTMALLGWIIHFAALAAAYFTILDHVAKGHAGLPKTGGEELGSKLWRGFMVNVASGLPLIVLLIYADDLGLGPASFMLAMLGALLIGALLLPAAALAVYAADAGLAAIAPHLWYRIISRMPGDYLRVALVYVALIVALWAAEFGVRMGLAGVPLLGFLVMPLLRAMFVFAMASALGGVVHRNRSELGI